MSVVFNKVFKDWAGPLANVEGPIFNHVINTLMEEYKTKTVLPSQKEVFHAFDMVDPRNLRVVIVGQDPYPTSGSPTGYAFANPVGTSKLSASLQLIRNRIEADLYRGLLLDFDPSLTHWADQGVLALNTAFTVVARKPGSHQLLWEPLFRKIILDLSNSYDHLYFCFWGNVAKGFMHVVDPNKHTLLFCYHPAYAVRLHTPWECDHFKIISEDLGIKFGYL